MKAITIWQPWASLLLLGVKIDETRSWPTGYRGHIVIHAAKKPVGEVLPFLPEETLAEIRRHIPDPEALPVGAAIGMADLIACREIDDSFRDMRSPAQLLLGNYTDGMFAWEMAPLMTLAAPIPCRGAQGLWEWRPPHG